MKMIISLISAIFILVVVSRFVGAACVTFVNGRCVTAGVDSDRSSEHYEGVVGSSYGITFPTDHFYDVNGIYPGKVCMVSGSAGSLSFACVDPNQQPSDPYCLFVKHKRCSNSWDPEHCFGVGATTAAARDALANVFYDEFIEQYNNALDKKWEEFGVHKSSERFVGMEGKCVEQIETCVDDDGDGIGYDCIPSKKGCAEGVSTCYGVKETDTECSDYDSDGIPNCMDFCTDKDKDLACDEATSADRDELPSSTDSDSEWLSKQLDDFYQDLFGSYAVFVAGNAPDCTEKAADPGCCCCSDLSLPTTECCERAEFSTCPEGSMPYLSNCGSINCTTGTESNSVDAYPDVTYASSTDIDSWFAAEKYFTEYDCDDNDPDISPWIVEDNLCNLINDDCDDEIDECSDFVFVVPLGTVQVEALPLVGAAVVGPVPEQSPEAGSELNKITGMDTMVPMESSPEGLIVQSGPGGLSPDVPSVQSGPGVAIFSSSRSCVYTGPFKGCGIWDYDRDGYMNASFGCPLCTDCNDRNSSINPGSAEVDDDIDNDCNGIVDESDSDGDGLPDLFTVDGYDFDLDVCPGEGQAPIDYNGCGFSTDNQNLPGWSVGP